MRALHKATLYVVLPLLPTASGCSGTDPAPIDPPPVQEVMHPDSGSSQADISNHAESTPPSVAAPEVTAGESGLAPVASSAKGAAGSAAPAAESQSTVPNAPSVSTGAAAEGSQPSRKVVNNLSDQVLATWGSSVCDGFSVPAGAAWPWTLERRFAEINGPKVSHVSTPGHNTDSKESLLERSKVNGAQFVVVCLSLGNQGLGSAITDSAAQSVVDSYLDDIFLDESDADGDPVSMVNYIESLGANPIVTLVYPMAGYTMMHCQHVVQANIQQQAYGIPTVNFLGPTNAGNSLNESDCKWANGLNAPLNVESDERHPNALGHDESFYAFPLDLPFAIASKIPFPVRSETTDYVVLARSGDTGHDLTAAPYRYTPEYAVHSFTMQFGFQTSGDGTLGAIDLGMNGFLTLEVAGGMASVHGDGGIDVLHSSEPVTKDEWHDVALTYSHVRQVVALYIDGLLVGEHDTRDGSSIRELFPRDFVLGGPGASGRPMSPTSMQLRDLFINRTSLHAMEIAERAKTSWLGAGSLDVYAPLRMTVPEENRAQTLQIVKRQR